MITKIRERAFTLAQKIIDKTGPRLAGTEASLQAAEILKNRLNAFCDKTEFDSFHLHKGAFLGWIRLLVLAYTVGVILLWLGYPTIAFILALISILILVLQFFLYLPIIDSLYPKKEGRNVIGYINPEKEIKRQIIISGHHDSARIFNFFIHQPKLYNLRVTGSIALVILLTITSLVMMLINMPIGELIIVIILTAGLLLVLQMWFFASHKGTPGAGDNLIASTMAIELGKYFSDYTLEHTRIIIASFDAEEEGLRGARAFAKHHKVLLNKYPTTLLNTDCAYNLDDLFFLTSDINGAVDLDTPLAKDLVNIAEKQGYKTCHKPIAFLTGGTDAAELAKVGIKATTLIGMPWDNNSRSSVYHTPNDTLDSVDPKVIEAAISIFKEYIENEDTLTS
ncbi:MAG: M20/M25/M40 family metallo-hydrolase [Candidatus Izemoplasma sp.]|nr:M20/M25/M40 family metallo-hydrolase [Candidatus Izemoplasma sp.]